MRVQCTPLSSPQGGGKYLDRWRKEEEVEGGRRAGTIGLYKRNSP